MIMCTVMVIAFAMVQQVGRKQKGRYQAISSMEGEKLLRYIKCNQCSVHHCRFYQEIGFPSAAKPLRWKNVYRDTRRRFWTSFYPFSWIARSLSRLFPFHHLPSASAFSNLSIFYILYCGHGYYFTIISIVSCADLCNAIHVISFIMTLCFYSLGNRCLVSL